MNWIKATLTVIIFLSILTLFVYGMVTSKIFAGITVFSLFAFLIFIMIKSIKEGVFDE